MYISQALITILKKQLIAQMSIIQKKVGEDKVEGMVVVVAEPKDILQLIFSCFHKGGAR